MHKDAFQDLCDKIEAAVGESEFLSEKFLESLESSHAHKKIKIMHDAHKSSTGGFACGEIRLAITLRLLAGSSYMDLGLLCVCGCSSIYRIFHYVMTNWICNDEVIDTDCYKNFTNDEAMKKAANIFSNNGRNVGMFGGAIGVLDGWSVKIKCPNSKRDKVTNFGSFYCRK